MASYTCPICSGTGRELFVWATSQGSGSKQVKCGKCKGSGIVDSNGKPAQY